MPDSLPPNNVMQVFFFLRIFGDLTNSKRCAIDKIAKKSVPNIKLLHHSSRHQLAEAIFCATEIWGIVN